MVKAKFAAFKRLSRKTKFLILFAATPHFLLFFVLMGRTFQRAVWGDEVDKKLLNVAPFVLWDCGTKNTQNDIRQDSCVLLATELHIPFRARYNKGGEHLRDISSLVRTIDGTKIMITAKMGISAPHQIQEKPY